MKLLVCGAGGMLGQDVVRVAGAAGHEVIGLSSSELDVTDAVAVAAAMDGVDAVLNCAAYTDVDGAEKEAESALAVNAAGAGNVARAAAAAGAAVVYVSSDYVFDGASDRPYVESDPTAPLSSYGRSKLAGERETAAGNPRHHTARSSWLFGMGGRNFVETMLGLGAERDEIRVVDDQVGSPTYTRHLAEGLLRLVASEDYGVTHMSAAGQCSWYDFAVEIFRRAGVDCRVTPCTTEEMARPAPRPAFSVLGSERGGVGLPDWRDGLDAYLAERGEAR